MGMSSALRNMNDAFAVVASFPEYKKTPLIIGECDPEGCAACTGPQETYRNGTMYSSYTAATFPRAMDIAEQHGVNLQGALTWAFEFEDQPPFAGFRALASDGLDLPVLNLFRMFAKMSGQRLVVESSAGLTADTIRARNVRENNPDVSALASLDKNKLAVLVWHYYDDDVPGPDANVDLALDNLPFANGDVKLTQYRIDANHSNSYEAWLRMGSPLPLSETQFAELEKAGQLAELEPPKNLRVNDGKLDLKFPLPRQAVALLVLTWN
jgi:xylan 1,4-beta-xylosidase